MTVLVVDDDAATREMLSEVLALLPMCAVVTAQSGTAALDILRTRPVDLVVLDVQMPGLSGPEVYRRLRERDDTGRVPVLFLSAGAHMEGVELDGPWRWMGKPFDIEELIEVAGELLGVAMAPTDADEPAAPAHTR